jgi:hypothetical protein
MDTGRLVKIAHVRRVARRFAFRSTSKREIGNFKMDPATMERGQYLERNLDGPLP